MRIEVEDRNEICLIRLLGRPTPGTESEYRSAIWDDLHKKGYNRVVVDCTGLPCLDSTGLGILVGLYKTLKMKGGEFALCGVQGHVREVLSITRLDEILPVFENAETAVEAVRQPAQVATFSSPLP